MPGDPSGTQQPWSVNGVSDLPSQDFIDGYRMGWAAALKEVSVFIDDMPAITLEEAWRADTRDQ